MVRTGEEEFFIEPLDRWRLGGAGGEEEEVEGRRHIIYRSSAVKKNSAVNHTADDFVQGETQTETLHFRLADA